MVNARKLLKEGTWGRAPIFSLLGKDHIKQHGSTQKRHADQDLKDRQKRPAKYHCTTRVQNVANSSCHVHNVVQTGVVCPTCLTRQSTQSRDTKHHRVEASMPAAMRACLGSDGTKCKSRSSVNFPVLWCGKCHDWQQISYTCLEDLLISEFASIPSMAFFGMLCWICASTNKNTYIYMCTYICVYAYKQ